MQSPMEACELSQIAMPLRRLACQVNVSLNIDEDVKREESFKPLTLHQILNSSVLAGQAVKYKDQEGVIGVFGIDFNLGPDANLEFNSAEAGKVVLAAHGRTLDEFAWCVNSIDIGRNMDVCETCNAGGDLLLCDGCPAAAHKDCAKMSDEEAGKTFLFCGNCKMDLTDMHKRSFNHDGALRLPALVQSRVDCMLRAQLQADEAQHEGRARGPSAEQAAVTVDLVIRIRPASVGFGRRMSASEARSASVAAAPDRSPAAATAALADLADMRDVVSLAVPVLQELPVVLASSRRKPTQPYAPSATALPILLGGACTTIIHLLDVDRAAVGANIFVDPLSWAVAELDGRVVVLCDVHLTRAPPVAFHYRTEAIVGCNTNVLSVPVDWFERHFKSDVTPPGGEKEYSLPESLNVVVLTRGSFSRTADAATVIPEVPVAHVPATASHRGRTILSGEALKDVLENILKKDRPESAPPRNWVPRFLPMDKGVIAVIVEMQDEGADEAADADLPRQAETDIVRRALQLASSNKSHEVPFGGARAKPAAARPPPLGGDDLQPAAAPSTAPVERKRGRHSVGGHRGLSPEPGSKRASVPPASCPPFAANRRRDTVVQVEHTMPEASHFPNGHGSAPSTSMQPRSAQPAALVTADSPAAKVKAGSSAVGKVGRLSAAHVPSLAAALDVRGRLFAALGMGLALAHSKQPVSAFRPQLTILQETISEGTADEASFRALPKDLQLNVFYLQTRLSNIEREAAAEGDSGSAESPIMADCMISPFESLQQELLSFFMEQLCPIAL